MEMDGGGSPRAMHGQPRKPRIGLLALTLELYEQLAPGLREGREQWLRQAVLHALAPLADVCFAGSVYRREDVETVVADYEAWGAEALLVLCLTYSPSQIALPALQRTKLPILVWNTQELWGVDGSFDGDKMVHNHGVHGTQDLANVLLRRGVPFHYLTSHLRDSAFDRLEDFFQAASAVAGLRRCRLGLMGYPFPGMGDFAVDTTHLASTLGCSWTALAVEQYVDRAAAAADAAVEALKAEYRQSYSLAEDLTEADLDATARSEVSLRSIVSDHRLDGLTYQFLAFGEDERTVTLPLVAMSRLMADGVGFAGEGDLIGAAGCWLLNRLCPPASFSEIFTIDFQGNSLFLSHMGEANVAMARTDLKIPLVARPYPITRTRGRQLALVTTFAPGPATLCALTLGPQDRWRLIVGRVTIDDFGPLASLPVPHCKVLAPIDVRQWLTTYAQAGGPHHHAICRGDARPRLRLAAKLLDADYCEVS
jgi:L-arabinose isomerase